MRKGGGGEREGKLGEGSKRRGGGRDNFCNDCTMFIKGNE